MKTKAILSSALVTAILAACSGNKQTDGNDSDSLSSPSWEHTDSVAPRQISYLTKDSIGQIKIGQSVNEIPDSVSGLYTKKINGASEDAVTITFADAEGEKFIAYDFGEGVIDVINAIGSDVKIKAPRGEFGLGDKFAKVLELPGVTTEWSGYDGNGSWYWVWEGLWFAPSQETLTETLSRRLYNYDSAPTPADFSDDVTVGFIGTGLPF